MLLSDYPGYDEGIARMRRFEDALRVFAMTSLSERINGIEVRQLTPRMLDFLVLTSSVFLIPAEKRREFKLHGSAEGVALFLWIVSLDNPLDGSKPPEGFFASLRPDEREYFQRFYPAIDAYMARAMHDRPASGNGKTVATSISASIVNRLAGAYGWDEEKLDGHLRPIPFAGIKDKPVARLYQYWRWILVERDPSTPLYSRYQDAFKVKCIKKWKGRAKAAGYSDARDVLDVRPEEVRAYLVSIGKLPQPSPRVPQPA